MEYSIKNPGWLNLYTDQRFLLNRKLVSKLLVQCKVKYRIRGGGGLRISDKVEYISYIDEEAANIGYMF